MDASPIKLLQQDDDIEEAVFDLGNLSSAETLTPGASHSLGEDTWTPDSEDTPQFRARPPPGRCNQTSPACQFRRNMYVEATFESHCAPMEPAAPSKPRWEIRQPEQPVSSLPVSKRRHDCQVLIEGPLQQRAFFFLWKERWCVLDRAELRVYKDEEASLSEPTNPLEQHDVESFKFVSVPDDPTLIECLSADSDETISVFRTGPSSQWEDVAAATLWLKVAAPLGHP